MGASGGARGWQGPQAEGSKWTGLAAAALPCRASEPPRHHPPSHPHLLVHGLRVQLRLDSLLLAQQHRVALLGGWERQGGGRGQGSVRQEPGKGRLPHVAALQQCNSWRHSTVHSRPTQPPPSLTAAAPAARPSRAACAPPAPPTPPCACARARQAVGCECLASSSLLQCVGAAWRVASWGRRHCKCFRRCRRPAPPAPPAPGHPHLYASLSRASQSASFLASRSSFHLLLVCADCVCGCAAAGRQGDAHDLRVGGQQALAQVAAAGSQGAGTRSCSMPPPHLLLQRRQLLLHARLARLQRRDLGLAGRGEESTHQAVNWGNYRAGAQACPQSAGAPPRPCPLTRPTPAPAPPPPCPSPPAPWPQPPRHRAPQPPGVPPAPPRARCRGGAGGQGRERGAIAHTKHKDPLPNCAPPMQPAAASHNISSSNMLRPCPRTCRRPPPAAAPAP